MLRGVQQRRPDRGAPLKDAGAAPTGAGAELRALRAGLTAARAPAIGSLEQRNAAPSAAKEAVAVDDALREL